jgi:anti-anti-sigma factor
VAAVNWGMATADRLKRELRRIEVMCVQVIAIDLSDLAWIDSTGNRLMLHANQRSSQGSTRLVLIKGSDTVQRVFDICDLSRTLPWVEHLPAGRTPVTPHPDDPQRPL